MSTKVIFSIMLVVIIATNYMLGSSPAIYIYCIGSFFTIWCAWCIVRIGSEFDKTFEASIDQRTLDEEEKWEIRMHRK